MYQDTIDKINAVAPFEIRMNMFLVECNELNQNLIIICERMIEKILKKVFEHITQSSADISAEIRNFTTKFNDKAENTTSLVEFEANLEHIKTVQKKVIIDKYQDMVEWLMLLYEYHQYEAADEIQKTVQNTYSSATRIQFHLDA